MLEIDCERGIIMEVKNLFVVILTLIFFDKFRINTKLSDINL